MSVLIYMDIKFIGSDAVQHSMRLSSSQNEGNLCCKIEERRWENIIFPLIKFSIAQ